MTQNFPSPLKLLAAIEAGTISARQAFDAYAARIASMEPHIGAFAHLDIRRAEALFDHQNQRGPLHGLPIGIKDIFDTADMPTCFGSAVHAGRRPDRDAAIVSLARRGGGSIIGKTTTTAFAFLDPTATQNPRMPGRSPGGSSAGSAAAVAAGMVPFAIGSQTGGSTVRPAAYCGVAGYKPSFKMLPTVGALTYAWNLDTVGLFAPTVSDVAGFAAMLSGRRLGVHTSMPPASPRIGLLEVPEWNLASDDMIDALKRAIPRLEAAGATLVDLGRDAALMKAWEIHATLQDYEAARSLAYEWDERRDLLPPVLAMALGSAQSIAVEAYDGARGVANRARKRMSAIFEDVDAILMPAAPGAAPDMSTTGQALFNRLFTLTGDPAIAVPGLLAPDGAPLGLQIIGPFGEDQQALAIAAWVEGIIQEA